MTPQHLLAAFDVLADAPDGVKRLRELVLSLAVRGKLVAQDPTEGAVGDLLAAIDGERAERVAAGEFRPSAGSKLDPPPFAVPASWRWVPLGRFVFLEMGQSPPSSEYNQVGLGLPFFQGKADFGAHTPTPRYWCTAPTKFARRGDVLLSVRAPVGPTNFADVDCCIGRGLAALRPLAGVPAAFILWVMRALEANLTLRASGTTFVAVSKQDLEPFPVPVPPLAEQHRIVARVEELMALLDRLEAARATRDAVRRAARDAALADLRDAPDAEAVEAAWGRIARQMDELFTEPQDVKPLREAVLGLAVRGRLASQDAREEPIARMLGRRVVAVAHPPFPLPDGWSWSSIERLGEVLGGGTPSKSNPRFWSGSIPWVSPKDMKVARVTDSQDHVSPDAVKGSSIKLVPPGSLLMVVRGMILAHSFPVAVTDVEVTVNQDMKALLPFSPNLGDYLLLLLQGSKPRVLGLVERSTHGTCKLPYQALAAMPLALAPLAEQRRIVAKVDALMALCDDIEARLTATGHLHGKFAAAAVHHLDV